MLEHSVTPEKIIQSILKVKGAHPNPDENLHVIYVIFDSPKNVTTVFPWCLQGVRSRAPSPVPKFTNAPGPCTSAGQCTQLDLPTRGPPTGRYCFHPQMVESTTDVKPKGPKGQLYIIFSSPHVNGPAQFKHMSFKGQLYVHKTKVQKEIEHGSSSKLKLEWPHDLAISLLCIYPRSNF